MARRVGILLVGLAAALALAAAAWLHTYGSSPLVTAVGLPGPAADASRECGTPRWHPWWALFQHPWVECRAFDPAATRAALRAGSWPPRADVTIDLWTRRVGHAGRAWTVPDTAAWALAQDSIARALAGAGGREVACGPLTTHPALAHTRARRFWRFPGYMIRLLAYHDVPGGRVPWGLQLDGYAADAPECLPLHPPAVGVLPPNETLKLPGYAGTPRDAPRLRRASAASHPRGPSA